MDIEKSSENRKSVSYEQYKKMKKEGSHSPSAHKGVKIKVKKRRSKKLFSKSKTNKAQNIQLFLIILLGVAAAGLITLVLLSSLN